MPFFGEPPAAIRLSIKLHLHSVAQALCLEGGMRRIDGQLRTDQEQARLQRLHRLEPEMRLVQELVAERLWGRVFGLKDVLENIAFVSAFLGAGGLLAIAGVRVVFVGAGLLTLALAALGAVCFSSAPSGDVALTQSDLGGA